MINKSKKLIKKNSHFGDQLFNTIRQKESFLCLGLDPHLGLIPDFFYKNKRSNSPIYSPENIEAVENFCLSILEIFLDIVPVIKVQIAFFEQLGPEGMKILSRICNIIHDSSTLCIIDAKRGDIDSTNKAYANTFFSKNCAYPCDAITVNPWLGLDSIKTFVDYAGSNKGIFILVKTSNSGSKDVQKKILKKNIPVYEELVNMLKPLINSYEGNTGLSSIGIVTGATNDLEIKKLRKDLHNCHFLIPGYGAQGAKLSNALNGLKKDFDFKNYYNFGIVNSSRGLCFPFEGDKSKKINEWKFIIKKNFNKVNNDIRILVNE